MWHDQNLFLNLRDRLMSHRCHGNIIVTNAGPCSSHPFRLMILSELAKFPSMPPVLTADAIAQCQLSVGTPSLKSFYILLALHILALCMPAFLLWMWRGGSPVAACWRACNAPGSDCFGMAFPSLLCCHASSAVQCCSCLSGSHWVGFSSKPCTSHNCCLPASGKLLQGC